MHIVPIGSVSLNKWLLGSFASELSDELGLDADIMGAKSRLIGRHQDPVIGINTNYVFAGSFAGSNDKLTESWERC